MGKKGIWLNDFVSFLPRDREDIFFYITVNRLTKSEK